MKLLIAKTYSSSTVFVIYSVSPFPCFSSGIWCFYFCSSIDPLLVLIEYVPYGDLLGYLRKSRGLNDTYFKDPDVKPQTSLTAEQLMRFGWQVADGMLYLSSRKVWLQRIFLDLIVHPITSRWSGDVMKRPSQKILMPYPTTTCGSRCCFPIAKT